MNIPNKLTLLRVLLIPVMVVIFYLDRDAMWAQIAILSIFVVASLTDFFDGYIARKYQLVTTFGKFLDPLADKLLVMAALLILQSLTRVPMWTVLVILSREFIVTGIRLVAMGEGHVIAASSLGKYKTASTMVGIILLLTPLDMARTAGLVIYYIGVALTIISGLDYFIKNKKSILSTK